MERSGDIIRRKTAEGTPAVVVKETTSLSTLEYYLYGKNIVYAIDMENIRKQRCSIEPGSERNNNGEASHSKACDVCLGNKEGKCATQVPLQSLRQLVHAEDPGRHEGGKIKATYAVMSFPDEVQLCTSSIPGAVYGACARRPLPSGTWIGPYEGRRIIDQRNVRGNHDYFWEIYNEGNFSHFIDGSDENASSWMRFIRCARNKKEQNMAAYQCGQNIYYRSFCDIAIGEELLVWYSDSYQKHLEIPLSLQETDQAIIDKLGNENGQKVDLAVSSPLVPTPSASRQFSMQPAVSEVLTEYHTATSQKTSLYQTESSTLGYSPHSLEPVASVVQQALANQIKQRIEKEKFLPSEEIPKKDPPERVENYVLNEMPKTIEFQDNFAGNFGEDVHKPVVLNDLSLPFTCKQCLKVFTQRIQLQMHVCPKSPYKPFQCGHCSQSFAHPSELRNHVVVHSSERPFKCGFCGRSFAGATTLNNHVRTHTGEKPFVCKGCGKTFAIATQLARHARVPGECPGHVSGTEGSKYSSLLENK